MKYILKTLSLLDILCDYFSFNVNVSNKYRSIVNSLYIKAKEDNNILLDIKIRDLIINYLDSLEIQDKFKLISSLLELEEVSELKEYNDLNDWQLLKLLSIVLRTINYTQKDNLLLLKYSKNIWNTGWTNLTKECRGKVIDLETRKVVVYPFDKFFNLNEVEETKLEKVVENLDNADYISVTDKKDGSAIIVTNYKGNVIINTNGEFENIQIELAKKLFIEKYLYFYNNIPEDFTFIFELIHPENRIVLDYGSEKKLYLLAIRDLKTLRLLKYNELQTFAKNNFLDITESFEFTNIYDFIDKTQKETKDVKEGWVFRVITNNTDFMFKLKYQEYFNLARIKNIPSLKRIYILLISDKLDDLVSISESDIKESILNDTQIIFNYFDYFKNYIEENVQNICEKYNVEIGKVDKDIIMRILKELKGNPFCSYILKVLKGNGDLSSLFEVLPTLNSFRDMYKYYNNIKGITEDMWKNRFSD